jgi:hypothetical protein
MLLKILLLIFLFCEIHPISAQGVGNTNLFKEGIILEKLKLTIPWLVDLKEIHNFFPKRLYKRKNFDRAEWDSVSLFGNISVHLFISFSKSILPRKLDNKMDNIFCLIKPENEQKIKLFLDSCTSRPAIIMKSKRKYGYHWVINNCLVELGLNKRFSYGNYLTVSMSAYAIKQKLL